MDNDLKFQIAYLKALQHGQIKTAQAIDEEYKAYLEILQDEQEKAEKQASNQNELKKVISASNNILDKIKDFNSIDDYISMLESSLEDRKLIINSSLENEKINKFAALNNMIEDKIYNLEKPSVEMKMFVENLESLCINC